MAGQGTWELVLVVVEEDFGDLAHEVWLLGSGASEESEASLGDGRRGVGVLSDRGGEGESDVEGASLGSGTDGVGNGGSKFGEVRGGGGLGFAPIQA